MRFGVAKIIHFIRQTFLDTAELDISDIETTAFPTDSISVTLADGVVTAKVTEQNTLSKYVYLPLSETVLSGSTVRVEFERGTTPWTSVSLVMRNKSSASAIMNGIYNCPSGTYNLTATRNADYICLSKNADGTTRFTLTAKIKITEV